MPIHVEIVSREQKVFEELEADMVLVPALEGQMGVLPRHAPTVASLGHGELIVKKGNAQESFAIFGGVVDVRPGKVVILAEIAESTYDIDVEAAEAARVRAQQALEKGLSDDERQLATLELRRATLELQLVRKIKSAGSSTIRILDEDETVEE
jgi:F-type H+-transporting ATPase subunit epsilon